MPGVYGDTPNGLQSYHEVFYFFVRITVVVYMLVTLEPKHVADCLDSLECLPTNIVFLLISFCHHFALISIWFVSGRNPFIHSRSVICAGGQIEKNEMGRTCGAYGG
jgi:hypothetical protein